MSDFWVFDKTLPKLGAVADALGLKQRQAEIVELGGDDISPMEARLILEERYPDTLFEATSREVTFWERNGRVSVRFR